MIDVSVAMGRILSPTSKIVAGARDLAAPGSTWRRRPSAGWPRCATSRSPASTPARWCRRSARRPPATRSGGCSRNPGWTPGRSPTYRWTTCSATGSPCWSGATTRAPCLDAEALAGLRRLGARLVSVRPTTQLHWEPRPAGGPVEDAEHTDEVTVIADRTGRLKTWFDAHLVGFVVLRPDRYVAAAALPPPAVTSALAAALHLSPA